MKLKRSKTIPLILLVYLIVMSIYGWQKGNHDLSNVQYWLTIGVTLVCIIALSYFLKKRDDLRDKTKNDKKEE